ncbi:MAG: CDP-alcohol phosphatidyltransferase family protein [Bacteroidetes bacterium]|nr:CDP-alcohol phosphatidyltransferase family protein [Bacteroidota bacterium]MCL5738414.1 CDP-alcohol phosphatidyltransferase family protein [Bacteroidota bacterium]
MNSVIKIEKRWTASNILSVSRIFLLIPIVILILKPGNQYRLTVLALMILGSATDFLDGMLARALNQVTDFGKLLDPLSDKICIVTASIALVIAGDVPVWYAVIVAARDLIILAGSAVIITQRKVVVQSVWTGKWTVAFIAAYLILATLRIDSLALAKNFFLYLSALFVFISLAVYTRVYQKHMSKGSFGEKNGIA